MKRKLFQFTGPTRAIIGIFALVLLSIFGVSKDAHANTAAGTALVNTVTVDYDDAAGVPQTQQTDTVTVTVSLVGGVVWVSTPGNQSVNSGQAIASRTLDLKNLGNGTDTFTLTPTDGTTENAAELSAGVFTVTPDEGAGAGVQITLFGTVATRALVAGDVAGGVTTIPVSNQNIAVLVAGTTRVVIGANEYVVAAGSDATHLIVTGDATGDIASAGVQIGEIATITLAGTAGTLVANVATSDHTHGLIATGLAENGNTAATDTSGSWTTTVNGSFLDVDKYVRNVNNASGNTNGAGGGAVNGGSTYYVSGVTGKTGDTLEYAIVITNTGAGKATNVVMEDTFSPYTTLTSVQVDTDGDNVYDLAAGSASNDNDIVDTDTGVMATANKIKVFAGTGGDSTTVPAGYTGGTGGEIAGGGAGTSVILYQVTID